MPAPDHGGLPTIKAMVERVDMDGSVKGMHAHAPTTRLARTVLSPPKRVAATARHRQGVQGDDPEQPIAPQRSANTRAIRAS